MKGLCLAVMLLGSCDILYADHADQEKVTVSNIMAACDSNRTEFII